MEFAYRFPAVKGIQARREYYSTMVPLKLISKLFPDNEEYVEPEYRAQRKLNEARIPVMSNYIRSNRDSYVFSSLTASIDGTYKFIDNKEQTGTGILEISMDARFLINDGQHRKAALLEALNEDETLGDETISVVFFGDQGLSKSQQMFTDLNKHAVKTSNSIAELYDSRDTLAVVTRNAILQNSFLDEYTDKEKDNLGKYSSNLFTLNVFYKANKRIIGRNNIGEAEEKFLADYWNAVEKYMEPWNEFKDRKINKTELRENYIAVQGVAIQALGRIGEYIYKEKKDIEQIMPRLAKVDWKRKSKNWKDRAIRMDGRIIANELGVVLTGNVIKNQLRIPLSDSEKEKEKLIQM